eukprot:4518538-Pleurochrysis_carterae.AAC.3
MHAPTQTSIRTAHALRSTRQISLDAASTRPRAVLRRYLGAFCTGPCEVAGVVFAYYGDDWRYRSTRVGESRALSSAR